MVGSYRLQLTPEFGFAQVGALLPYLKRLGISHLYLSPITEARPGSAHGYDVVNHNAIREDLGGRPAFEQLESRASEEGFRIILDFVPNHAGVGPKNDYWQDVLAYGPHSPYSDFFDIDWNPLKPELHGKILLPFLGDTYGETFDRGEIGIAYEDGRFYATYFDHRFALSPGTYQHLLRPVLEEYERTEPYWDLKGLIHAYDNLEPQNRTKAETLQPRLTALAQRIDVDVLLASLEGPALHDLLERQYWRLSYWKTAGDEINYRRFFDINSLVALRMEDDQVFWDAHRLLGELLVMEGVEGVRIDHIDGLFDPHKYLESLRDLGGKMIWVEKILAAGEILPGDWPVEGTTGYEFLNDVLGVLIDRDGRFPLERAYRRFVPRAKTFEETVYRSKRAVMSSTLSNELFRLAYELDRISESDYRTRDFTLDGLREALAEVVAAIGRYRTYLPYEDEVAREVLREAVHRAYQRNPAMEPSVYQFIERVILGEVREDLQGVQQAWVGRFQQYTAPVAAKGVEDTAFYRYFLLAALNEVGAEPEEFGCTRHAFHSRARFRAIWYPNNLLPTATHDHKRGEDTRMRLAVLSEVAEEWEEVVTSLAQIAERHRLDQGPARSEQYLFYQMLVALWHGSDHETLPDRLWEYSLKAARERKLRTSWIHQNETYENALESFVRGVTTDERLEEIISPFAEKLARHGFFNMISETVIKYTSPGVPDLYQGAELLDLSLVDPDNRRPVDYSLRSHMLDEFTPDFNVQGAIEKLDERAKLALITRLLHLRREKERVFEGAYVPLNVQGADEAQFVGYARTADEPDDVILVVASRFSTRWNDDVDARFLVEDGRMHGPYVDVLTGRHVDISEQTDAATLPMRWAVLVRP